MITASLREIELIWKSVSYATENGSTNMTLAITRDGRAVRHGGGARGSERGLLGIASGDREASLISSGCFPPYDELQDLHAGTQFLRPSAFIPPPCRPPRPTQTHQCQPSRRRGG